MGSLFGLTDAPAIFQGFMNSVFKEFLQKFIWSFWCILMYGKDWETHLQHLETSLLTLRQCQLFS